ncbi:unnamed protein product [Mytilus coruscus]|uniref:Uncharacterized protein n=1 Tax=Mytilus coruscus TaxID=42192 RepID=A0A6J8DR35_MYTCO|nr:unnamed protein product [Mytilus coruscus]
MADQNDSYQSPGDTHDSTKSLNSEECYQSPGDTHDSSKSINSEAEDSPHISEITNRENTQSFASEPTDSNTSPGGTNIESTDSLNSEPEDRTTLTTATQITNAQSLNSERKPKTWCCVLVGTKCGQILEDVPLLLANGSQLRAVFELDEKNRYYFHLLILVILSVVSYILLVFFTVIGWYLQNKHTVALKPGKDYKHKKGRVKYCCCCTKKYHSDEYNESDMCQCPYCHVNFYLNSTCYILVFITICANIGITGIGISVDC